MYLTKLVIKIKRLRIICLKSTISSLKLTVWKKNIINYNANISNLKSLNNQIESYSNDYSNELDAEPLHQKQVFELKSLLVNRHKLLNSNNMSTGKNNILYLVIFFDIFCFDVAWIFNH